MGFQLDPKITIGDLLTVGSIVGGGFLAYFRLKERIVGVEQNVSLLMEWFKAKVLHVEADAESVRSYRSRKTS